MVGELRATHENLDLTAVFRIDTRKLVLSYRVTNRDSRDAYLLNILHHPTPQWNLSPDLIYVDLIPGSSLVRLLKKIPDLPADCSILSPVAPFVTPLRPGARFAEEVHIALPVTAYREYNPPSAAVQAVPRAFKGVAFTLGYFWSLPGMKEDLADIAGHQIVVPLAPRGARLEFGELTTPVASMDIPVLSGS